MQKSALSFFHSYLNETKKINFQFLELIFIVLFCRLNLSLSKVFLCNGSEMSRSEAEEFCSCGYR